MKVIGLQYLSHVILISSSSYQPLLTIGAGSKVYENAYLFLEKLRIYNHEPKSHHRIKSEGEHSTGYPLKNPPTHMWVFAGPK